MTPSLRLGGKVRALRRRDRMTQADLADRLGISASYLNLIEHDRRPLPGPLLVRLAQLFGADLAHFAGSTDTLLSQDLEEVFLDPLFQENNPSVQDVRELVSQAPGLARAVLTLYEAYRHARLVRSGAPAEEGLAEPPDLDPSRLASEEVSDFLQRHGNHFPELEAQAEALWDNAGLERQQLAAGLVHHLRRELAVAVRIAPDAGSDGTTRRYDPERRVLTVSEVLPPRSRSFQLAHQLALIATSDALDRLVEDPWLTSPGSTALARVALANYYAAAVLMPYTAFFRAAGDVRYDVELLGHRFQTSYEQVCHRLTTLQRPGHEGVPFHFIRVDIAGNISKRFSASGIRIARFSGCCPRWNVHQAFLTPGLIRVQLSRMPGDVPYFCFSRTVRKGGGGYHAPHTFHAIGLGCHVRHAPQLVYADGVNLDNLEAAVPIGTSCRTCDRNDCEQRAFPQMNRPLWIDENVRGVSFYSPAAADDSAR